MPSRLWKIFISICARSDRNPSKIKPIPGLVTAGGLPPAPPCPSAPLVSQDTPRPPGLRFARLELETVSLRRLSAAAIHPRPLGGRG